MANPNSPYTNASNASQYAGYAHFYGSPGQPQQSQHHQPQQPQYAGHARGPPVFARPPPLRPPGQGGYPGARPMPPPPGMVPRGPWAAPRGPPRPPAPGARPPAANQWQWSSGRNEPSASTSVVASAPPVMYGTPRGPPQPSRPAPAPSAPRAHPSAEATGSTATNSTKWPDALHDYVKRAFARCKGATDQSITQNTLKQLISNAITSNALWTKNWLLEPLPTLVGDIPVVKPNVVNYSFPPRGLVPPPARGLLPPSPHNFGPPHGFQGPRGAPGPVVAYTPPLTKAQKRKADALIAKKVQDMTKKNQRRERFLNDQVDHAHFVTPTVDLNSLRVLNDEGELDLEAMVIKGTCQTIEKEYLRLTSPPHPSTVRPLPVLKKALEMVQTKWKASECDYIYACSQLKSIRQDCTVQHIKDEFTVRVYETHARVALESGDINEFNQCQTQLHELYEKSIPGQAIEFLSYRILYCIYVSLQAKKQDSNAGQLGMYNVLASVTPALRVHESVRHALAVRQAVTSNDYHGFFKLYANAPKMTGYLMDPMVATMRLRALRAICKAYRPNIPIDFVRQELSLEGAQGDAFIKQSGIVFVAGSKNELVDTKSSDIVWVLSDQSSLI